ncbi:amidohydrolase family protein (plasmid) [Methylobacterium sp. NMS12]|uniref:amidohydrolase family protein n=1 Tax=Methylobacterium sp. NMS12 TaxID=3079766 RepID=UPI003F884A4C
MDPTPRTRRSLLGSGGALALAALGAGGRPADAADAAPFSAGTEAPAIPVPPRACDCHIHILSTRFPASPHWKGQPVLDSDVAAYRRLQARLGTSRAVVVTPSTYGTDNRAVVVVDLDIGVAELRAMAAQGAVGIRVNFGTPQSWGPTTAERLEAMARKVAPLGWHVQIYATGDQIVGLEPVLRRLPTRLVIDHLARLPPDRGVSHPAHAVVRRLLDGGGTWMKLSGAYLNTASGPPAYADATTVAKSFAAAAPERMLWGSDWPHRGETHVPDDARLLDLLADWVPDERTRARVLADNPAALYGFD